MAFFTRISLFLLLSAPLILLADTLTIRKDIDLIDISNHLYYMEDEGCAFEFSQVKSSDGFVESSGLLNMGVTKSCFWVKMILKNESNSDHFQVVLEHPILDLVEFYDDENFLDGVNEKNSFYERTYQDPNFIFDIFITPGETGTYFLKISGSELIVVPLLLGTPDKVLASSSLKEMLFGIYAGIILVMFIYNLFVFFSVRDRSYLYYVLYILFIGLTQASLKGFTTKYLWPESTFLIHYGVIILSCLAGIFALEFLKVFLHTKELDPKLHPVIGFLLALFGISIILCFVGQIQLSFSLMQLITAFGSVYALIMAIRIYRTGFRPAKFFLIAWSILLLGAIIFVSKDFELVPYNIYSNYSLQVASILEVVLLSFALADKINVFRQEKEQSQLEALKALEENERIIREQNIILEAKVEERTAALKVVNEDLNLALGDLKNAQSQLVSAEKMASLGQLTAGIAHEINNPINYVKSSVRPLKDNVAELLQLINVYETNLRESGQRDAEDKIKAFKEKIQFEYLIEETMDVINNIEEGANRTVEIVSGLRTFSHVDDIGLKLADINKGIKSTLNLLSGEAPPELKINLKLGKLPEVECYGGKINQVFMNILNNAIQAIKAKARPDGEINITTTALDDRVRITIEDNGIGMTEEVKEKIFDPFFTTKDVGEGTGLGLSVVYGIIESHHGSIDVLSEPGKGASFIINLPYLQPK